MKAKGTGKAAGRYLFQLMDYFKQPYYKFDPVICLFYLDLLKRIFSSGSLYFTM